jgi:uncharacterized protein (TIGR02996 family)
MMTAGVAETREALERALDDAPGDTATRRVLADLLDEYTDERGRAEMLRWTAAERKWPHHYPPPGERGLPASYPWAWTCENGLPEALPHAGLPRLLCRTIGFGEWRAYRTRREAEDALFAAWQEVGW